MVNSMLESRYDLKQQLHADLQALKFQQIARESEENQRTYDEKVRTQTDLQAAKELLRAQEDARNQRIYDLKKF